MRGRRSRWGALLLVVLLLSGCWDMRDVEERSTVLVTGADRCGEEEECRVRVTWQIAIPGGIPLGAGESTAGGETVYVLSQEGKDAADAQGKVQAELNQKMDFGHIRALIISEALAREGLEDYLEWQRGLPQGRPLQWFAIAEGRSEEVLRAKPALERVPALFLSDMFEDAVKTGRLPNITLGHFKIRLSNRGEDAVAPLIRAAGPDQPELAGLAVFRKHVMVGKLTPVETVTFMQLSGIKRGSELIEVDLQGGRTADLKVSGRQVRYQLRWVQGRLHVRVSILLEADMERISPGADNARGFRLELVEQRAAAGVSQRAGQLVQKLQEEYGADVLAVGERVRAYLPGVWQRVQDDWAKTFAEARFEFDVRVQIRRTGLSTE